MRRAGTSKRAMAAATARRTRTTNPTTWPAAIRRARAGGAAATMATATTALSTLVLTNAKRGDPDFGRKAGHHRETRQPSVRAGMAGPNGWSPRRVTRWAKRGVSP